MQFWDYLWLELIKTFLGLLLLTFTWIGGQQVLIYWDLIKKRQEFDFTVANQFYQLYGEFRAVQRLWRVLADKNEEGKRKFNFEFSDAQTVRLELLKRSVLVESGLEAIILKLSIERSLTEEDMQNLGLLRQAYQMLREAIRDNKSLSYSWDSPEYKLLNNLVSSVGRLISPDKKPKLFIELLDNDNEQPELIKAQSNLREISGFRSNDFKKAVDKIQLPANNTKALIKK